ncbi:MAG TPA: YitT family protein [Saprospiraceae bacterium]|nr:YitT family protein [Saprospiraceae bacterium]
MKREITPFWTKLIIKFVLNEKYKGKTAPATYSKYDIAKGLYESKLIIKDFLRDIFLIILGILSAGFGLKGFLLPNHFLDGGATGISLLLNQLFDIPLALLIIVVNIPFILFGFATLGRQFAIKTIVAIIGLALAIALFPYPEITQDKLLVAVFGGFFLGAGIGLAVRGGAVVDGTEVLAIAISRQSGLTIGDFILLINVCIFSFAAYFLTIEIALYAMLTYLSASKTVDFILEGIEEYTGVTIVSIKPDELREMIAYELNSGVTVYKGERGYGKTGEKHHDLKIIYTVITRLEVSKLKNEIHKIDPNAFIVMTSIKDTIGGMTKRRRLH